MFVHHLDTFRDARRAMYRKAEEAREPRRAAEATGARVKKDLSTERPGRARGDLARVRDIVGAEGNAFLPAGERGGAEFVQVRNGVGRIEEPVIIRSAKNLPEGLMPHMPPMIDWHFSLPAD